MELSTVSMFFVPDFGLEARCAWMRFSDVRLARSAGEN
jgi:hypothetical protein